MPRHFSESDRLNARKKLAAALSEKDDSQASSLSDEERQERAVVRAIALVGAKRTTEGLATLESVMHSKNVQVDVFYHAGEYALELQNLHKALDYFSRAIAVSVKRDDTYYLSSCYLLRAYILIGNGDFEAARRDLEAIEDDDVAIGWISNVPRLAKSDLMNAIEANLAKK